ncbi:MAG: acyl-CoA/acyl-ACP dehydrogenase [Microbacteriaceae bacterium]|jgi:alkylation response protein AidB-like acyl-CoA dehydrogenase|nr:acyl-CoA/acyl-ACP dehydrogenase [Microbacteriaceae bacterium]
MDDQLFRAHDFDPSSVLPDDLIQRIRSRAAGHDAEASFPWDDLEELRALGYLGALTPTDMGGLGLTFTQVCATQARLATAAPGTALAINMHLVWAGVARYLHDRGDHSLDFVLAGAAAGETYAFGISEVGNDLVLLGSSTEAVTHPDGSVSYTGTKIFTSLSPAWTWLGTFGLDTADPEHPQIVYGFVPRTEAVEVKDDWHALGMRASCSCTTKLHGATAPADRVVRRLSPGPSEDPIVVGIFVSFSQLVGSVYTGIVQRALELACERVKTRRSVRLGTTYDHDPDIRWRVAEIGILLDGLTNDRERLAERIDAGEDLGAGWFPKVAGFKHRAVLGAKRAVDEAMLACGGHAFQSNGELARLYRDAIAGVYHPSDPESVHATFAQALLGPLD